MEDFNMPALFDQNLLPDNMYGLPSHNIDMLPSMNDFTSNAVNGLILNETIYPDIEADENKEITTNIIEDNISVQSDEEPEEIEIVPEVDILYDEDETIGNNLLDIDGMDEIVWEGHFMRVSETSEKPSHFKDDTNLEMEAVRTCHLCNKQVASNYNLKRHMMIHTGERPHTCDICGKGFIEFGDVKKHLFVHSAQAELGKIDCLACSILKTDNSDCHCKNLPSTDNRRIAAKRPTKKETNDSGSKLYICTLCKGAFSSRHNLKRHQMIHTGEKPFKCKVCDRSFRELSTLKKHAATHVDVKSFKCETCEAQFGDAEGLRRHQVRFHNEVNVPDNLECPICEMKFKRACNYTAHVKRHSEAKFKCNFCEVRCKTKLDYRTHVLTHINADEPKKSNKTGTPGKKVVA